MALAFTERVRNHWWTAQEEGRAALVERIKELREAVRAMDAGEGLVQGTGTDGVSVSLMRTRPEELRTELAAAREALVYHDDGRRPGAGGRAVVVSRRQNRSVS